MLHAVFEMWLTLKFSRPQVADARCAPYFFEIEQISDVYTFFSHWNQPICFIHGTLWSVCGIPAQECTFFSAVLSHRLDFTTELLRGSAVCSPSFRSWVGGATFRHVSTGPVPGPSRSPILTSSESTSGCLVANDSLLLTDIHTAVELYLKGLIVPLVYMILEKYIYF